ncbi:MAG: helix-hairpin-helix domain-containing protein [Bacteroidaceae bacterium]|nr:helix-hairpin-helix domain-containing protein [Bacteroidaceae bacterium]
MKRFRQLLLLTLCLWIASSGRAQFVSWDSFLERQAHNDEAGEASFWENFAEEASYLHDNPININASAKEQLEQLPFLSPKQVEDILFYIDYYGPLHTVGELMLISSLDYDTRQALSFFVTFGEKPVERENPTLHDLLTKGRQSLITRLSLPFYTRDGYQPFTLQEWEKTPSRHYWGNKLYQVTRYSYQFGQHVFAGLTGEKDAGEPFFTRGYDKMLGTRGYDYYSGYVQLKDIAWLRNLTLGCYRLSFGQGLVVNNNFSLGKNAALSNLERSTTADAIHRHGGTNEADFLRGIAATVKLGDFELTGFGSYRHYDATLTNDSIATFLSSGLHRTSLEMEKHGNVAGVLVGGHLKYSWNGLHTGLTAIYQRFNQPLASSSQAYRHYYPQGSSFFNVGADYAFYRPSFSFLGETAVSGNGGWATLNTLRVNLIEKTYLTLLQRHYAADYWGLQANAFSEGSEVRNEEGVYIGADVQRFRHWRLSAYADFFRFPWERYRVASPSKGIDIMSSATYSPNEEWSLQARYRCKAKERDVASAYKEVWEGGLFREVTQRIRLHADVRLSDDWAAQAAADYCQVNAESIDYGVRTALRISFSPQPAAKGSKPFRISSETSWFHTTGYAARIYSYEHGLPYSYGYRSFYGKGLRSTLLADVTLLPRLTCSFWATATRYFDRSEIGSGAERIPQNHAEELSLQLQYKF